MNTSYKHNITLLFLILATLPAFSQFRMIGTASWAIVTDSTYSGTINFQVDLTGKGYLATSVVDTFRVFTGTEQIYTITSVGTKTFSSAQVTIKEYNGDHGIPIGQVMVYDPAGKTTLPQAPFGSTGSTAQLQAAVDTYNSRLLSSAGVDLTPYSTTLQMRQEISDSIATVTGLADGDKGDITVSGSGATWTIDANAVDADNIATNAVGPDEIAPSGVAAASYTAPNITVDQDGRITSATSNTTIVNRAELGDSTAAIRGDMLTGNEAITLSGDVTGTGTTAITTTIAAGVVGPTELENTAVTPGAYTNANITVDADGRVTAASSGGGTDFTIYDGTTSENAVDGDSLVFIWDEGIIGAVGPKSGGQIDINVKFDGGEAAAETTPSNNNSFLMDDASQNRLEGITWPNLVGAIRDSITGGGSGSGSLYILHAEDFYTTDWAAAINTAIDSLNGLGGGTVILPPDTLSLNRQTTIGTNDYCILLKDNVQLTGHGFSTVLRLADNQVTDTYPTTHIIYGVELFNSGVSNMQIIGNTLGQTGYTGGYQQGPSGQTGVYTGPGGSGARGENFILHNVRIFDCFGSASTIQYLNKVHIENYEGHDSGELLEVGWSADVTAEGIYCKQSYGGDGIEFAHVENLRLSNFIAEEVDFGYACDVYGVTEGVISNGVLINSSGGMNLHHTETEPPPSGFMDSLYNLVVINVLADSNATYGLNMVSENLTNITVQNFISTNNGSGGLIAGYSSGYGTNWNCKFYDCQFSNNTGTGAFIYDPILIEFYNCSFNDNSAYGISNNGPSLVGSQDSVGVVNVWGGQMRGNGDEAVSVASATVKPRMTIQAYMENNNVDGAGAAKNRNYNTSAPVSEFVKVRNTRPSMTDPNSATVFAHGEQKIIFESGANIAQIRAGNEDGQIMELFCSTAFAIINGYDDYDIRTLSATNEALSPGEVMYVVFNVDSLGWFQFLPGADDLGDHIATQNIQLNGNYITNDGGNEGIRIDNNGNVGVGRVPTSYPLEVQGASAYQAMITNGTTTMYHNSQGMLTTGDLNFGTTGKGSTIYVANGTDNFALSLSGSTAGTQKLAINDSSPDFSLDIETTDAIRPPKGTDAQRPASPVDGVFRWSTTSNNMEAYYGGAWHILPKTLTATGTLNFGSTSAQSSADLTITVTGAASGDVVALGVPNGSVNADTSFSAWVSAANTVTVRFNNYSSGAVDPASGTFRVSVMKY